MNQLVAEGGRVYIEFCVKCEQHQWCTKHNSAKYLSYFNNCRDHTGKNELMQQRPDLTVLPNAVPPFLTAKYFLKPENDIVVVAGKRGFPRIGAFEVYYRGQLVFSKLSSGLWPHPAVVCESIAAVDAELERKAAESEKRKLRKSSKKRLRRKKSTKSTPYRGSHSPSRPLSRPSTARVKQSASGARASWRQRPQTAKAKSPQRPAGGQSSEKRIPTFHDPPSTIPRKRTSFSSSEGEKQTFDEGVQADCFQLTPRAEPQVEPRFAVPLNDPSSGLSLKLPERPMSAKVEQRIETISAESNEPALPEEQKDTEGLKAVKRPPEELKAVEGLKVIEELKTVEEQHERKGSSSSSSEESRLKQQLPPATYSLKQQDEEDYEQSFESSEKDPEHPLRPVTKSYPVEIPMGKHINKKITITNDTPERAIYTLVSSHPKEMEVKEVEVSVDPGEKGPLRVQFAPVYDECTKKFYLYVDQNDEPFECFEFVVTFN